MIHWITNSNHKSLPNIGGIYPLILKVTYIFLLDCALFTVVGIRYSRASTDDTASLIGTVVALITDTHQRAWSHIGITDDTLSIT